MFGKKPRVRQTKLTTVIAHDVHLTGNIEFSNGLRLDGQVQGNVTGRPDSESMLLLSDCGVVHGTVHAYHMVINGTIVGDVISDHFLELQANARITGNIYYQQLRLDYGATVEGKLVKQGMVSMATDAAPLPAPALAAAPAIKMQAAEEVSLYKLDSQLEKASAAQKAEKIAKEDGNSKKSTQRNLNAPIGDQLMKAKEDAGIAAVAATAPANTINMAVNSLKPADATLSLAGSLTKRD